MKKLYYLSIFTLLSAQGVFAASASSCSSSAAAAIAKEQAQLKAGESNSTHTCWNVEIFEGDSRNGHGPYEVRFSKDRDTKTTLEEEFPQCTIVDFSFVHTRNACVVKTLKK